MAALKEGVTMRSCPDNWDGELNPARPKVVVMCGSSRFIEIMAVVGWFIERDELAIVMGLHLLPWWYDKIPDHLAEAEDCAEQMDELHLRKIDMADEIYVIDDEVDGEPYIGESTRREVAYARARGVHTRWFSEDVFMREAVFEKMRAGIERTQQVVDAEGNAVQAGDTVYFRYGIPPVRVEGVLFERDGELVMPTKGHNPEETTLTHLNRCGYEFWKVT